MTDVGKVTVGVEVSGAGLGEKLAAEIERAVRPAIAAVNRQLDGLNAKLHTIDSGGFDKLALRAREAAMAIGKTGSASRDASLITTAAVDKSIRDYRRLADAAEMSANRQIAAAARVSAAQQAMSNRQTRSTGGGANHYMGGSRGSALTGGGGLGGFLTSPVGVNAIALAAGSWPAMATSATHLLGAVQTLSQGLMLLPGIFSGIATSAGVAVLGLSGVGTAIGAFWTAFKSGDIKDLDKANESLRNMAPSAQSAVKALGSFFPVLQQIKMLGQQNMFAGLDQGLRQFATATIPTVSKGVDQMSRAWNNTFREMLRVGGQSSTQGFFTRIFGNTADAQNRINQAIQPFVHAMGTLTAAGSDTLPRLASILTTLANKFDAVMSRSAANGNLERWLNNAITGFQHLGAAVINIGKVIGDLTRAAGGNSLAWLDRATASLHAFLSSDAKQSQLAQFFREGAAQMAQWRPILSDLFRNILPAVLEAAKRWADLMLPFLGTAIGLLGKFPNLLQALVLGFITLRTINPFTNILRDITAVNSGLASANAQARTLGTGGVAGGGGPAGQGRRGRLAGIGRNIGIMAGAQVLMSGLSPNDSGGNDNSPGAWLQAVGGGAALGASIGSGVPVVGTALGAGIGAAAGASLKALNDLLNSNREATQRAAAAAAQHADALRVEKNAIDESRAAMKSMSDALMASQGVFDNSSLGAIGDQITQIPDRLAGSYDSSTVDQIKTDFQNLGLTTEQMSQIVVGAQSGFDALKSRLTDMGPAGAIAATQLQSVRDAALGAANNAAQAAPLLQQLSTAMGVDTVQAAANLNNAFAAIPHNVPINVTMPGGQDVLTILKNIGVQLHANADGVIQVDAPMAPEVLTKLQALGWQIQQNRDGTINVQLDQAKYAQALDQMGTLGDLYKRMFAGTPALPNMPVPGPTPFAPAPGSGPGSVTDLFLLPPGKAGGGVQGVLPGYSPGRDNMLVPLSGGEGILIPEAVRALGSDWVYGINSMFRGGISRRGYDDGGVYPGVPGLPWRPMQQGGGQLPTYANTPSEINSPTYDMLQQMRNLLQGSQYGPLMSIQMSTSAMASGKAGLPNSMLPPGTTPSHMGPFGTMIPAQNKAYDFMSGVISGLGGNPELVLGPNPLTQAQTQWTDMQNVQKQLMGPNGQILPVNPADYVSTLQQFAQSGIVTPEMRQLGLDENDQVVGQILQARQKPHADLEGISAIIQQALTGQGYVGPLTDENKGLLGGLSTFRQGLEKKQAAIAGIPGVIPGLPPGMNPQSMLPGGALGTFPWDAVAQAESSGNWANADTGNNGHYGGLQFSPETWKAYGGLEFAPRADMATPEQQKIIADRTAFTGHNGLAPQGLGAWEAITKGMVPGVTVNTPRGGAVGSYNQGTGQVVLPPTANGSPPWAPTTDNTAPQPGPNSLAPGQAPPPGAVWVPGVNGWVLNGVNLGGTAPAVGAPTTIPAGPPTPPVLGPPIPGMPPMPGMPGVSTSANDPFAIPNRPPDVPGPGQVPPFPQGALGGLPAPVDVHGASQGLGYIMAIIQQKFPGLKLNAGASDHSTDGGWHPKGQAIDIGGDEAQMNQLTNWLLQFAPNIEELIHQGTGPGGGGVLSNIKSGKITPTIDMPGSVYNTRQAGYHGDHAHLAVTDQMTQALISAMTGGGVLPPGALGAGGFAPSVAGTSGGLPGSGAGGVVSVFVTNWPATGMPGGGGMPGAAPGTPGAAPGIAGVAPMLMGPASTIAGAAGNVASGVVGQLPGAVSQAAFGMALPASMPGPASLTQLVHERNPLTGLAIAGFDIPDFSRNGPIGYGPEDIAQHEGPSFDATGRMYPNTTGLIQRSFTDMSGQMSAMRLQLVAATKGVSDRLADQALGPVLKSGVSAGISAIPQMTLGTMGNAIGQAAAVPISNAVASSGGQSNNQTANDISAIPFQAVAAVGKAGLFASGGGVTGGTIGVDSVPIMAQHGEWVLNTDEVDKLGGFAGMTRLTAGLARHPAGTIQHFASGGGVLGGAGLGVAGPNQNIGADWFGLSQIPIIGAIINLIISVLMGVIGAQVTVRDTLLNTADDFRKFRGEAFQPFDATGRLMGDTSGMSDRHQSSEETVANERVRILEIVIQKLIQYIIEKVIVPLIKAVADAAINAGAAAAGSGINMVAPGAGGIAQAAISSFGQAGVDIASQVGSDIAVNISDILSQMVAQNLMSNFGGTMTNLFGGNMLGGVFQPLGAILGALVGLPTAAFSMLLGGTAGDPANGGAGALTGWPGAIMNGVFDDGGIASGVGLLPKATLQPERVLSPSQTRAFDRLVDLLASGDFRGGSSNTFHAPITVMGGPEAGKQVRDGLLSLLT